MKLADIASIIGFELKDSLLGLEFSGIATLKDATPDQLSFLSNPKYAEELKTTQARAVFVKAEMADECGHAIPIVVRDPYLAFAKTLQILYPQISPVPGVHPTAVIDPSVHMGAGCEIGPYVVIGRDVIIGDRVKLGAGVVLGDRVQIGQDTQLYPHVTVYPEVKLGQRVLIHSGTVVGSDGFGYANDRGQWVKIPQIGSVVIGDDVEIGANTMIDRGALSDTCIESGVKIDNGVQIAHNVQIGAHTAIAAATAIAGSTRVGKYCMIGGSSAIAGHLVLEDQVMLAGASTVGQNLKSGEYGSAITVQEKRIWQRNMMRFIHLDDMAKRFKALEKLGEQITTRLAPLMNEQGGKSRWRPKFITRLKWIFSKF